MGWMNWLSLVALGTGIAALAVSLGIPGPVGPIGPQGPMGTEGPAGPGTLMNSSTRITAQDLLDSASFLGECPGSYLWVNITVPGPGTVIVSASVVGQIERGSANPPEIIQYVCLTDWTVIQLGAYWSVERNLPSGRFINAISAQGVFTIAGPGTHSFTLMGGGAIFDFLPTSFLQATMVAVFYPS